MRVRTRNFTVALKFGTHVCEKIIVKTQRLNSKEAISKRISLHFKAEQAK